MRGMQCVLLRVCNAEQSCNRAPLSVLAVGLLPLIHAVCVTACVHIGSHLGIQLQGVQLEKGRRGSQA
jgi:hypothetical protein